MRSRIHYRDPARPPEEVDLLVPSALLPVERKWPDYTRAMLSGQDPPGGIWFEWYATICYRAAVAAGLAPPPNGKPDEDALDEWLVGVTRLETLEDEGEEAGEPARPTEPEPAPSPAPEP